MRRKYFNANLDDISRNQCLYFHDVRAGSKRLTFFPNYAAFIFSRPYVFVISPNIGQNAKHLVSVETLFHSVHNFKMRYNLNGFLKYPFDSLFAGFVK